MTDTHRRDVAAVGVVVGAVLAALTVAHIVEGDWEIVWVGLLFQGWVVLWLGAVSLGVRSLGVLDAGRAWLLSFFLVYLVVWAVGSGTKSLLGEGDGLQLGVVVPAVEELAKLLPVVAFFTIFRRGHAWPTVTDAAWLGFVSGAAFGFREDLLRDRVAGDGFVGSWGAAFPTILHDDGRLVLTHGGWTLVAAVGLALTLTYRHAAVRIVGALLMAVVVVDHGAQNAAGDLGTDIESFLADGTVMGMALVAAIVLAVTHDLVVLRRLDARDDLTSKVPLRRVVAHLRDAPGWSQRAVTSNRLRTGGLMHSWRTTLAGRPLGDRSAIVGRITAARTEPAASVTESTS